MQEEEKRMVVDSLEQAMEELDETQGMLEGVAYDILNCSDSIKNATSKVMQALEAAGFFDNIEKDQTIVSILDCLEELSTFTEDMSMCAHYNEEISSRQHEIIEQIKEQTENHKRFSNS
ncbi:MAG: hypothetical protein PWP24_800 [Clostridiales bacterium]|nr:hypothetical protein [Clostridiales bacterium]